MSTHVVTVCAKRFYHVYVSDPKEDMATEEIMEAAKRNFLEEDNHEMLSDTDIGLEEGDVLFTEYEYTLYE